MINKNGANSNFKLTFRNSNFSYLHFLVFFKHILDLYNNIKLFRIFFFFKNITIIWFSIIIIIYYKDYNWASTKLLISIFLEKNIYRNYAKEKYLEIYK